MISDNPVRAKPSAASLPSRKSLPPFESLRAFDAVARLGGIRRAAQYLCRDHGVVSRHLRTMETWAGTKLIERTPTGSVLTEEGNYYHRHIAAAIDSIANATVELIKRGETHRLHIRCMPGFALHWLSRHLWDFEQTHPGLDIEVRPADRTPDYLLQHADVDIRFVATYSTELNLPPELKSVPIAQTPIVPVASPQYLSKARSIRQPRDLLKQQLLHEENFDRWRNWFNAHEIYNVDLAGPRLWQGHLTLDTARHGRGIALSNRLICHADFAAGRLIEVGRGNAAFQPDGMGVYHFVAKLERWNSPLIHQFRHWLLTTIAHDFPQLQYPSA